MKRYIVTKFRWSTPNLVALLSYVANTITPKIHEFILMRVYNSSDEVNNNNKNKINKKKRKQSEMFTSSISSSNPKIQNKNLEQTRNEKHIPHMIYQVCSTLLVI